MRLNVVIANPPSQKHHSSLFVRLHPNTVKRLHSQALSDVEAINQRLTSDYSSSKPPGWNILEESGDNHIEFLPLALITNDGSKVYVSYNGGSIEDEHVIQLHPSLLPSNTNTIQIQPLLSISNATTVQLEPLTLSEWELFECHARYFEHGGLLRQVTVVFANQILSLSLPNSNDVVRVKVLLDDEKEEYLKLVQDTKVVVAPKPRPPKLYETSVPLRLIPVRSDLSQGMKDLYEKVSDMEQFDIPSTSTWMECPPPMSIVVHPKTLEESVPGWKEEKHTLSGETSCLAMVWNVLYQDDTAQECQKAVVRVFANTKIKPRHVALNTCLRYQIAATPLYDSVQIEILTQYQRNITLVSASKLNFASHLIELSSRLEEIPLWLKPDDFNMMSQKKNDPINEKVSSLSLLKWVESLPKGHDIPIISGSLLSVIVKDTEHHNVFAIISFQNITTNDESTSSPRNRPLFFIYAKDLPSILSPTSTQYLTVPRNEHLSHLLPSNPSLHGLHDPLSTSLTHLQNLFSHPHPFSDGLILHGEDGTGKTHLSLLNSAFLRHSYPTLYLNCKLLQSSLPRMNDILSQLSQIFSQAWRVKPCLLILEDLDSLAPNLERDKSSEGSLMQQEISPQLKNQVKLISDCIISFMEELKHEPIVYLTTCKEKDSLDESLRSIDRFNTSVEIPSLNGSDRWKVLKDVLMYQHNIEIQWTPDFEKLTEGYCPRDLKIIAERCVHWQHLQRLGRRRPSIIQLPTILNGYTPLSLQNAQLSHPKWNWSHIAGLHQTKPILEELILHPLKYRKIYSHSPITLPKGILLYGPSGCGKSILPPALAKRASLNYIVVRGPSLLSRYIGSSEHALRQIFQRAIHASPSLLFFDEIDSLTPKRGTDSTGVMDRIVNQFLTFLDGMETKSEVYVIGSTIRPDWVDKALLRPGRLEKHVYVGFPEEEEERREVLEMIGREFPLSQSVWDGIGEIVKDKCVKWFSPADYRGVLNKALMELRDGEMITKEHLLRVIHNTKPSVSQAERMHLERVYEPFWTGSKRSEEQHVDHVEDHEDAPSLSSLSTTWDKIVFSDLGDDLHGLKTALK